MIKPRRPLILGIDPGISGAYALYDPTKKEILGAWDFPLTGTNKKKKSINNYSLAMHIDTFAKDVGLAVIEQVGAMPKQGVVSTFRFGEAFGLIQGIVASAMIPIFFPKPAVWKSLMGVTREKETSLAKASAYFPSQAHLWAKKTKHGRAEAALLAVFGERLSRDG